MTLVAPTDWQTIKDLYIQGVQPVDLCKRFKINAGTLGGKATRLGWTKARKANVLINQAMDKATPELNQLSVMVAEAGASALQERGLALLQRLARDCERTVARLEASTPADVEGEELRERTLKMLTDRVTKSFGLEHSAPGQVVMIGFADRILKRK